MPLSHGKIATKSGNPLGFNPIKTARPACQLKINTRGVYRTSELFGVTERTTSDSSRPQFPLKEGGEDMNPWRKLILFCGIVIGPAILVGISNFNAFPDSSLLASIMLIITVVVAGIFTWKSNDATPKISRYCIIADIIICAILCVNMGSHWILSREVSGAKQSTAERHTEEDREEKRRQAEIDRQVALKKAEADLAAKNADALNAETRRLSRLPRWLRESQSPVTAPATSIPTSTIPAAEITPEIKSTAKPKATEEEVRDRWWWLLTALAFAECFASVLAGGILIGVWEWDRNHDGIADHLQQGRTLHLGVGVQPIEGFARRSQDERGEDYGPK